MYYTVEDVMKLLGVGRTTAYKMIRKCNAELSKKGFITVSGKVPKKYLQERLYGK